jgi:ribonuclease HII
MRDPKTASTALEDSCRAQGYARIAGIDEAGRGAWAGPVVAAVVMLPLDDPALRDRLRGVRDSKTIGDMRRRSALAQQVYACALGWGIGEADVAEIDRHNIVRATKLAMRRALDALGRQRPDLPPDLLLLDYIRLDDDPTPQLSQARMDSLSLTVAAASLLAKTYRDARMIELDERYPGYEFARNKGYGQPAHRAGLDRLGACPAHRMSFKPLQRRLL